MHRADTIEHDDTPTAPTCVRSRDEHVEFTVEALTFFGIGIHCQAEYEALMVLAALARKLYDFPPFDPETIAEDMAVRARAMLDREQTAPDLARGEDLEADPSQVH